MSVNLASLDSRRWPLTNSMIIGPLRVHALPKSRKSSMSSRWPLLRTSNCSTNSRWSLKLLITKTSWNCCACRSSLHRSMRRQLQPLLQLLFLLTVHIPWLLPPQVCLILQLHPPVPTYRPPLQSYNIHQTPVLSSDDRSFSGSLDGFGSKTQPWMGEDFSDENVDYLTIIG